MSLQTTFVSVIEPIASTSSKLVKHSEFSYGCRYLAHKLEESLKEVKLEKKIYDPIELEDNNTSEIQRVEKYVESITARIQVAYDKIRELEKQYERMHSKLEDEFREKEAAFTQRMKMMVQEYRTIKADITEESSALNTLIESRKAEVDLYNQKLTKLLESIETAERKHDFIRNRVTMRSKEAKELEGKLEIDFTRHAQLKIDTQTVEKDLDLVKGKLDQATSVLELTEDNQKIADKILDQTRAEVNELQERRGTLQNEMTMMQEAYDTSLKDLEEQKVYKRGLIEDLEQKQRVVEIRLDEYLKAIDNVKPVILQHESKLDKVDFEAKVKLAEVASLEKSIEQLRRHKAELANENEDAVKKAESKVRIQEDLVSGQRETLKRLKEENENQHERKLVLAHSLETLQQELDITKHTMEKIEENIDKRFEVVKQLDALIKKKKHLIADSASIDFQKALEDLGFFQEAKSTVE